MYFRNLLSMVKKTLIEYYGERDRHHNVFKKLNNSAFAGENLLELTKT